MRKIIQKSGAIILSQRDPSLIALLYRSKQGDWSFPKGHIEKGEAIIEAMRREIAEETGMSVRLISDALPPMEYIHPEDKHIIVFMFLVQSEDDSALKVEFDGDRIAWVSLSEVANKVSHDNIRRYYASIFEVVNSAVIALQSQAH